MSDYLIKIDLSVYDAETLKKTIYKFADKFSADLNKNGSSLTVGLIPKNKEAFDFNDIKAQFLDELLDQDLRKIIASETEDIRNVIVAKAFANADIQ